MHIHKHCLTFTYIICLVKPKLTIPIEMLFIFSSIARPSHHCRRFFGQRFLDYLSSAEDTILVVIGD